MQNNILIIKPYGSDNNSFLQYIANEANFKLFCVAKFEEAFIGVMIVCWSKDVLQQFRNKNNEYLINFQLEDESHNKQLNIDIKKFISREKNILSVKTVRNALAAGISFKTTIDTPNISLY